MQTVQYVLLDYSKDKQNLVIATGSKQELEIRLDELKKTQHYLDDPGRYDIMPSLVYNAVFVNDFNKS